VGRCEAVAIDAEPTGQADRGKTAGPIGRRLFRLVRGFAFRLPLPVFHSNHYPLTTAHYPLRGYDVLRILMALLLLTAAGLKCHELATQPIIGKTWLDSRWLLMAAVEFELFFGLWLLFGNCSWSPLPPGEGKGEGRLPRLTWAAALALFSLFTCVSSYKASAGYSSCGCFGAIRVWPGWTAAVDFALVLSLLRWRPRPQLPSPGTDAKRWSGRGAGGEGLCSPGEGKGEGLCSSDSKRHRPPFILQHSAFTVCCLWLVLGLPAACLMSTYTETTLADAGEIIGDGKIVVLKPETWIGKHFPLLDYIDIGDRLREGKWLVLLYRHDCPDCRAALPYYQQLSAKLAAHLGAMQIALIEVPPYGDDQVEAFSTGALCTKGRLTDATEWLAETPQEVVLDDTVVIDVRDGKSTESLGIGEERVDDKMQVLWRRKYNMHDPILIGSTVGF
jgi:hypothetical protein